MTKTTRTIVILLLLVVLAACATPTLAPEVFVFPQSAADDGTMEDFRKQMEDAEKANLSGYQVELKLYTTEASLEEVIAYYDGTLQGWKQVEKTENTQGSGMTAIKWTDDRQVFMVMYGPDPLGSGKTALYTERVWKE